VELGVAFEVWVALTSCDDVLATGGTAASTCELVERAGAVVVEVAVLMELGFLSGRERLAGRVVHSVVTV